jgi:hypothetical protein
LAIVPHDPHYRQIFCNLHFTRLDAYFFMFYGKIRLP